MIDLFAQATPGPVSVEDIVPNGVTTADWIRAGILIGVALLLSIVLYRVVVKVIRHGSKARAGVARLLARLAGMLVFLAGFVYALNTLGVRLAPLLGALGIVGIAIAFALQDILENFIAGVLLQARNPFRFGDQIASGDWQGTVEDINFRAVVLHTFDGTRVVLPSSMVLKEPILNLTAFPYRRTTVTVGVAYGSDLRHAAEVIATATKNAEDVFDQPDPEVFVEELADSSINFAVRFWHRPEVATMWLARSQVLLGIYEALGREGIEIPFPQRTLSFNQPLSLSTPVHDES